MIQPMRLLAVGTSYRDAWTTVQKKTSWRRSHEVFKFKTLYLYFFLN